MISRLLIVIVMGLSGFISGVAQTVSTEARPESQPLGDDVASASTQSAAQQQGVAALTQINYDWQTLLPSWTIEFSRASSGPYGMTFTRDKRIEVYVRSDQDPEHLAHVIAHELGHAVDVTLNTGDDRRAWQQARGIEDSDWWPNSGARDFSTGAGDFAESFANWQLDDDIFRSTLADEPDSDQLDLLATLANTKLSTLGHRP